MGLALRSTDLYRTAIRTEREVENLRMPDAFRTTLSTTWRDDAQPPLSQLWAEIEERFGGPSVAGVRSPVVGACGRRTTPVT